MLINKNEIAKILTNRGAIRSCHRCGRTEFTVLDGYSIVTLQEDFRMGIQIGGLTVPVTYVACNNCGAITAHALGALGLIPDKKKEEE